MLFEQKSAKSRAFGRQIGHRSRLDARFLRFRGKNAGVLLVLLYGNKDLPKG